MDYSLSGAEDPHFSKELVYGGLWTFSRRSAYTLHQLMYLHMYKDVLLTDFTCSGFGEISFF